MSEQVTESNLCAPKLQEKLRKCNDKIVALQRKLAKKTEQAKQGEAFMRRKLKKAIKRYERTGDIADWALQRLSGQDYSVSSSDGSDSQ